MTPDVDDLREDIAALRDIGTELDEVLGRLGPLVDNAHGLIEPCHRAVRERIAELETRVKWAVEQETWLEKQAHR